MATAMVVALGVGMVGCGQAAQSIEPQSTQSAVPAIATPVSEVPKYTTKKKLSKAEKEAAEGALVTLVKYNREVVALYRRGGDKPAALKALTTKSHLNVINTEMQSWEKRHLHMEGTFVPSQHVVTKVIADEVDSSTDGWVRIEACVPFGATQLVDSEGTPQRHWANSSKTLSFVVVNRSARWLVDDTGTEAEKC